MESKMMPLDRVKSLYHITERSMKKAVVTMNRRHKEDEWIITRETATGEKIRYIYLEGVDWIKQVYRRPDGYYLDAEISFTLSHIKRLQEELQDTEPVISWQDMDLETLCSHFDKQRRSIQQAIALMCKIHPEYKYIKAGKTFVSGKGVAWMGLNRYKEKYLQELQKKKRRLQQKKREVQKW
ncbi:hypothetical protein MKC54_09600 [[Clostridium] innocuum]|nr:hypothetical protein [[Clostridium] innocuum]MCR0577140.1 hypothetical protein [[Clostridium] innocuum]